MPSTVDLTIEPSDKYRRVIGGYSAEIDRSEPYEEWPDEHKRVADAYIETADSAPVLAGFQPDCSCGENEACSECPPDDGYPGLDVLTWDDISPSRDPDLLAKVATYFDGIDSDEPSGRIRAKCRLLDVETYAKAQTAARTELREA